MAEQQEIKNKVRNFIRVRFLNGSPGELQDNTPLISGGVIDSISTMLLVSFLEKEFKFEFQPHEVDRDNLDSVDIIARFVSKKTGG